jgi:hypothetical protein
LEIAFTEHKTVWEENSTRNLCSFEYENAAVTKSCDTKLRVHVYLALLPRRLTMQYSYETNYQLLESNERPSINDFLSFIAPKITSPLQEYALPSSIDPCRGITSTLMGKIVN